MIIGMLAGGGLVLLGAVLGRYLPARRTAQKTADGPICGCTHHLSYHDPVKGVCNAAVYVPGTASRNSHHAACGCRQYTGPQPLPEFYAPEIGS